MRLRKGDEFVATLADGRVVEATVAHVRMKDYPGVVAVYYETPTFGSKTVARVARIQVEARTA